MLQCAVGERLRTLFILIFLFLPASAMATNSDFSTKRKLRMACVEFAPFEHQTPEGSNGLFVERARDMARRAGYDIEPVFVPIKRMPKLLSNGDVDLWVGLTHYKEFKEIALAGTKTLMQLELMTYTYGRDLEAKALEDLKKYRLLLMSGYSYGGLLDEIRNPKNKFSYIEVKDNEQAFRLLSANRADIFLNYKHSWDVWQKNRPTVKLHSHLFATLPVHIAVSRKTLEANDVLKNLERNIPAESEISKTADPKKKP
ncbi:MAG TPA: transporter substrate-binding domain-containing protein [Bdellovibrio sp.]|nr:transporter substrate-binding domain-containing protein [Bdellovibrio sp.]